MMRLDKLESRVHLSVDDRLYYFSNAMPKSSGRHSDASRKIRAEYGENCLFCGTSGATLAHLVAGNVAVNYSSFSRPKYRDDLDVKSPRNFIPLCGTYGQNGTCHNEFDCYKMSLLFHPFTSEYRIFCLDAKFQKYNDLNDKVVAVSSTFPPYRRLLAWRARKCVNEHPYLLADRGEALLDYAKFSEISRSVAAEEKDSDEAEVDDHDSL
jgi:hypothetical protein